MKPELFLLMGMDVDSEFWSDVQTFKGLDFETQCDIVEKAFRWFGVEDESFDNEWDEWVKDVDEKELEKRKSTIRFILFITQQVLMRKIPDERLILDLKELGLDEGIVEKYIQLKKEHHVKFSKALAEKASKRFASEIRQVDWRIEHIVMTPYEAEIEDTILMLRIVYRDLTGKQRKEVFEFSKEGLEAFIDMLNRAHESMKRIDKC